MVVSGLEEDFQSNIFVDKWNTLVEFFENPSEKTFWKIVATEQTFSIMPFVGGYLAAEAYAQVARNPTVYSNAKISEEFVYAELMNVFKITFWKFFELIQ